MIELGKLTDYYLRLAQRSEVVAHFFQPLDRSVDRDGMRAEAADEVADLDLQDGKPKSKL